MTQYDLFGETPQKTVPEKKETIPIKTKQWYSIDGYKEPGLVILIMDKWVEMDSSVSPCSYARIEDLTLTSKPQ